MGLTGIRERKLRQLQPGMDSESFKAWLNSAEPNQICIYFEGHNLADSAAQDTALAAKQAFAAGEVELLQRRVRDKDDKPIEYLAIKRKNYSNSHSPRQ